MNTLDIQFNSNSRNFKVMTRPASKLQDENWSIGKVENLASLTWKTSTRPLLETWPDQRKTMTDTNTNTKTKWKTWLLSHGGGSKTSTLPLLETWPDHLKDEDKVENVASVSSKNLTRISLETWPDQLKDNQNDKYKGKCKFKFKYKDKVEKLTPLVIHWNSLKTSIQPFWRHDLTN